MKSETLTLPPILPNDVLVEILLKLPVISLSRFKCVCKLWLSLISDPQFAKSHFEASTAPTHRFLLNFFTRKLISLDMEAVRNNSANAVFNIPLPLHALKNACSIIGSCRGFLLLTNEYLGFLDFIIWNPSTGLERQISNMQIIPCLCGIGYDSSTDDYVVVNLTLEKTCTKVTYFTLRTNSWSCIEHSVAYKFGHSLGPGLLLNGSLHWLVKPNDRRYYVIIAFDVVEKKFSEIPPPQDVAIGRVFKKYCLRVMDECLCICLEGYINPETWTMEKYKVQSSWTKSSVPSTNCYYCFSDFFPYICFTKIGEIWELDDKRKFLRPYGHIGKQLEHDLKYQPHGMMYRESLLSLPEEFEGVTKDEQWK